MKQKIAVIGLLLMAAALITTAQVKSHGPSYIGDAVATTLSVQPEDLSATNSGTLYDVTGTNFIRWNPTNMGGIWLCWGGSNMFCNSVTNIVVTNTAGTTRTLFFRCGLFVGSS